jgi:hypothetical protein
VLSAGVCREGLKSVTCTSSAEAWGVKVWPWDIRAAPASGPLDPGGQGAQSSAANRT